jgi:hypothetical protein
MNASELYLGGTRFEHPPFSLHFVVFLRHYRKALGQNIKNRPQVLHSTVITQPFNTTNAILTIQLSLKGNTIHVYYAERLVDAVQHINYICCENSTKCICTLCMRTAENVVILTQVVHIIDIALRKVEVTGK